MKINQKQVVSFFILFVLVFSQFAYPRPASAATIRYVIASGGLTTGPCDSWGAACTLQRALAASFANDEIWVQQGTYTPGIDRTDTFTIPDSVAVYGGFVGTETLLSQRNSDPSNTILSGEIGTGVTSDNVRRIVTIDNSGTSTTLDGFTITLGYVSDADGDPFGAGIYVTNSSPTLNNLIIANNYAGNTVGSGGGGVYIADSNTGDGLISPHISNVTFSSNQSGRGGGLFSQNSNPVLENVTFINNAALGTGGGGANIQTLYVPGDGPTINPSLTNVAFINNTATGGGGMFLGNSTGTITNVTFDGNTASRRGGGLLIEFSTVVITNVTFYNNTSTNTAGVSPRGGGGLMILGSSPTLNNTTFSGNTSIANGESGSAIRVAQEPAAPTDSNPVIRNSIFWGNNTTEITSDGTGSITVSDSVVEGGFTGTNIITTDPLLGTLADNGGFTQTMALGVGSSAIGAGNNSTCASTDQRGISRPQGSGCDMGAYEYDPAPTITDRSPTPNATGVAVNTNITVTFSEPMNAATITGTTFTLRASGAGSDVPAAVSYSNQVATLDPISDLSLSTLYTVTVSGSVADTTGNTLGSNNTWSFSTVSDPTTDTTVVDFNSGTVGSCVVDGGIGDGALRLNIPGSTTCTFLSRIFDADESVDWDQLVYTGGTPIDTTITFETRTGRRFVQDDTWFDWQSVSGNSIASLDAQYLQYRVTLTTTNTAQTPTVEQVTLSYNTKSPAVLGTPSGALTSWDNAFSWTGLSGGTYYLLEVYNANTDVQLHRQWYTAATAGCDVDTSCVVSPSGFNVLANGNYKWRIFDQGSYGYGLWTAYTNFTLNAPVVALTSPTGTLTSWSNTFNWTGNSNATLYLLDVYNADTNAQVHRKWYSNIVAGCDADTSCSISPTELASLANGNYKWRLRDYGAYGYGFYTDYLNFTLNVPPPPVVISNAPTGMLTSWNHEFTWIGLDDATLYLLDVYDANTNAQVHRKWYSAATAGCDTDTSCSISPAELTNLANGSYKWRIRDYGTYGYGPYTGFVNFTLNIPPPPVVTLNSPIGTLTSWNNTFNWTGITGPTLYLLDVYDANTNAQVHRKWYTVAAVGCDTDTSCSISPAELANLPNGSYNWRIRDYGVYGYGPYTGFVNFVLAIP